ncbi:hypothetical protein GCM10010520_51530 [Rhizobium viscosum]|uniref:Uncharacterized protein n=1 Tax=Rhizobium viscosum TaxID=1673 RepID=A0ABR9IZ85_RHIVS|nr:hypothetical protein [Rhizobium viscosum]MBE1508532.1 hypothetical protein [Rhizobium viscosum]
MSSNSSLTKKVRAYLSAEGDGVDADIVSAWLNDCVRSWCNGDGPVAFAPFSGYFADQSPLVFQLTEFAKAELSKSKKESGPSDRLVFTRALLSALSNPLVFGSADNDAIVIATDYAEFFEFLCYLDVASALKVANTLATERKFERFTFANEQPLLLELFRRYNRFGFSSHQASKFIEAVFGFLGANAAAFASAVPNVVTAKISSVTDDYVALQAAFERSMPLAETYRSFLSEHAPEQFVDFNTDFFDRVARCVPTGFTAYLEDLSPEANKKIRVNDLVMWLKPPPDFQVVVRPPINAPIELQDLLPSLLPGTDEAVNDIYSIINREGMAHDEP